MKSDKQYQVTISGQLTDEADLSTDGKLREEVIGKYLNASVSMQQNTMDEMMNEEFSSLARPLPLPCSWYLWSWRPSSSHPSSPSW